MTMEPETLQASAESNTVPLHSKAEANLQFIRDTMEGASAFTSISGAGLSGAGIVGLAASLLVVLGVGRGHPGEIILWLCALVTAFTFSTAMTMRKARHQGTSLWSASGKKLLYAFCPTMAVGGVITLYALVASWNAPLSAIWLSLYGAALMTAGAYSIILLRFLGAAFIGLGILAFFTPLSGNLLMAIGFGGLHVVSGILIWKYHGG